MEEKWDLVVAGAGPAGCALAGKVARRGAKVLLLEREEAPGEGRDWVVDVARGTFEEASVPPPEKEALWREPPGTLLVSSGGQHVIDLPASPLVPVRNGMYVRQLADWAVEGGARLRTRCTVTGAVLERGAVAGVTFVDRDGAECRAASPLVADCSGMGGAVRRSTPPEWGLSEAVGEKDTVLARREVWSVDAGAASSLVTAGSASDGVRIDRSGAYGVYSVQTCYLDTAEGFVDVLIGVKPGGGRKNADQLFDEYMDAQAYPRERVFGDGGPIPIRRPWNSLVAEGLLVLGDCACQVVPMHGSGTASALIAADLAAEAVFDALKRDEYGRDALWGYSHAFMSGRGAVLAYYDVLRGHTDDMTVKDLDRMIARGVLTADDVISGLMPEPPSMDPLKLARRVARGIDSLPLLAGFALTGLKAIRQMRHYGAYPSSWNPDRFAAWEKGVRQ